MSYVPTALHRNNHLYFHASTYEPSILKGKIYIVPQVFLVMFSNELKLYLYDDFQIQIIII